MSMEARSNSGKERMMASSKMVVLEYFVDLGKGIRTYTLVRFGDGEPWLVLDNGELLATIEKKKNNWKEVGQRSLEKESLENIGRFIEDNRFNFIAEKIKAQWPEDIAEVIRQDDQLFLVVCTPQSNFSFFRSVFSSHLQDLLGNYRKMEFKVYNACFDDEFYVSFPADK